MPNAWDAGSAKLFASLGFAGHRHDELRLRRHARPTRRRGDSRGGDRPHRGARRGHAAAGERRSRGLLRRRPGGRGGDDHGGRRGRRSRGVGRGLHARDDRPIHDIGLATERVAAAAEAARAQRAGAHGAGREPDPRDPRPRRHDPPAAGVPGGRRRRALRAGAVHRSRTCGRSCRPSTGRSTCSCSAAGRTSRRSPRPAWPGSPSAGRWPGWRGARSPQAASELLASGTPGLRRPRRGRRQGARKRRPGR